MVDGKGGEGSGGNAKGEAGVTVEACHGEMVTGYSICFYLTVG